MKPQQEAVASDESGATPEAPESRADVIGALWDAAEEREAEKSAPKEAAPAAEPPPPAQTEAPAKALQAKAETKVAPPGPPDPAAAVEPNVAQAKTEKAPQSWTPAAREKWATLPGDVRVEVAKREKEILKAMQDSAPDRKLAQDFRQKVAPFEAMLRAEGVDTLAATESLLHTAMALRTAPVQHKAAIVASIISGHGIDPGLIAQALQGKAPQQNAPAADPNAIAAQVEQRIRAQMRQEQEAQATQQHQASIEKFAAEHEFFPDLEPLMADIINGRRSSGLPTTLEDAYTLATQLHPQVSAVLKQRETESQANAKMASTQRARAAAASIKGSPAGSRVGVRPQPMSRMEAIEAAWAEHSD